MQDSRFRPTRRSLLAALALIGRSPLRVHAQSSTPVTVAASGLVNPRGFDWDASGVLHVASAGSPESGSGVVRIDQGCPSTIVAGWPAYRIVFGGMTGIADVAFVDGDGYFLLSGGDIDRGNTPNGLYRFADTGETELVADISAFIRDSPVSARPRDYDTDGQPYALLPSGEGFLVSEGNSNQLLRISLDGEVNRVADLSPGHPIPTGVAPAPDGGAFVAFFTSMPYIPGGSRVVEVAADGAVREAWTGLTLVTAMAAGPDGSLYALEMATGIDPGDSASIVPGTGRVVRQTGPDTAEVVATGLTLPVSMAFGPDGALYVAGPAFGADGGEGVIVRIDLTANAPVDASLVNATRCTEPSGAE